MKEALQMVREALGEEAIIVATREIENAVGGRMTHITAAVEREMQVYDEAEAQANPDNWLYENEEGNGENSDSMTVEELTETMLRHAVPDDVMNLILSCATVLDIDEPRLAMMSSMQSLFKFTPFETQALPTPIILVGPSGAGKTLACAKLAARGLINGLDMAVITTDTERAGGREQLEAFTRLMQIDLKIAATPTDLKEALMALGKKDQIIIDTAGSNPFDKASIERLSAFINIKEADPVLVMPANTNADEAAETAEIYAAIGVKKLLPTRVDATRRLGSILAAAHAGGLALTDFSATPKVADGLSRLNSKRLTQLLMPRAETANIRASKKAG